MFQPQTVACSPELQAAGIPHACGSEQASPLAFTSLGVCCVQGVCTCVAFRTLLEGTAEQSVIGVQFSGFVGYSSELSW
jgi:hypothetical protein